jgi:hypothetical protein
MEVQVMATEMSIFAGLWLSGLIKPQAIDSSGAIPPENSVIRKIAEDVLARARYSLAAVFQPRPSGLFQHIGGRI